MVDVGELAHTVTHAYPEKTVRLFFYRCQLRGEPKPMMGQQMRWVHRRELAELPFPDADRDLIGHLVERPCDNWPHMKSVADDLRAATHRTVRELPLAARIELALALGDDDLALFMRTSGLSREQALAVLQRQRVRGRRRSVAAVRR